VAVPVSRLCTRGVHGLKQAMLKLVVMRLTGNVWGNVAMWCFCTPFARSEWSDIETVYLQEMRVDQNTRSDDSAEEWL
jgi:hypothetical protein